MRSLSLWARLLGVERTIVEGVDLEASGALVVRVRPKRSERRRCGICHHRSRPYDAGDGRRRWRALDLGTTLTYLEASAPRVRCPQHGVVVAAVPWARHGAGFTRTFEDQSAWLAVHCSKSAVAQLMRMAWRTVGRIITRVVAETLQERDLLAGLTQIGIDEISFRKGQRYLMVVIDHQSGRLVWAAEGREAATVQRFFDQVGEERCTHVSTDGAEWLIDVIEQRCRNATICLDPFHVVSWATKALDDVRREVWNLTRKVGLDREAADLKGARWALLKNPENLTDRQRTTLAIVEKTNRPLYRAYLLKEELRLVFQQPFNPAKAMLRDWISWARRCRLEPFVELARTITYYRLDIESTLRHRLANALVESTNTKIRLIARRAFGFHSANALIALAILSRGGLCPPLPGR